MRWRGRSGATRRGDVGLGRFAGWPSLVRLAISAPEGSAPQFLWEEIVAGLSGAERQLLLALATLGWGTASDVAWVAGSGDGGSDPLVDAATRIAHCHGAVGQRRRRRLVSRSPPVGGRRRANLLRRRSPRHQATSPRVVPAAWRDAAHRVGVRCVGVTPRPWPWPAGDWSTRPPAPCRSTRPRAGCRGRPKRPVRHPTCASSKSPCCMPAITTTPASTTISTP